MENSCHEDKSTCYEQFPQELPELDTVPSLELELRKGTRERIAQKALIAQQNRSAKQSVVPTIRKLVYPLPPKYKRCQHSDNFILDREILNTDDHINFIAIPREKMPQQRPHYAQQKLPSITNRIKTLARPGLTHVKATLEGYSSCLSPKQKQHLVSLLEPKPFVSIPESIGYAKQQRSDDAMWRRHRAKQEIQRHHNIHRLEMRRLKETMRKLCQKVRHYYLFGSLIPMEENSVKIARTVLRCISRFLNIPVPNIAAQANAKEYDVMDDFYIEFAEKIGHWIWRMMETTGISLDKKKSFSYIRKSESLVSVNSSVFELPLGEDVVGSEVLEPMSIISLELINECLDDAVYTVENGVAEMCKSSFRATSSTSMEVEITSPSNVTENTQRRSVQQPEMDQFNTSTIEDDESIEQPFDTIDEDQVTVIENIPIDEVDEDQMDEEHDKEDEDEKTTAS